MAATHIPARISAIDPAAVLPGGEIRLHGAGFMAETKRAAHPEPHPEQSPGAPSEVMPEVIVGGHPAHVVIGSDSLLVVRVPDNSLSGDVAVTAGSNGSLRASNAVEIEIAVLITENVHPVCNPAVDASGDIVVTYSGARGQKTPVSLFKLDTNFTLKPLSTAVTNPSGLAFDRAGTLFVSSRQDGAVYRIAPNGAATLFCEGLGIATGIAFDADGNLYVGDRSGTIFKIDSDRNIFVFATLEPSVAAYHLAFGPDGNLYVSGPTTSSSDAIWRISPSGTTTAFFRGLGRPQGIAFDREGGLNVVASYQGRRGIIRITPDGEARLVVSGGSLVGLAFARGPALILATHAALHHLKWPLAGLPLLPQL